MRTRIHPGSDLRTRTRTGCCGSTFPKALTYHAGPPKTSKQSLSNSTTGHAKHSDGRLPQRYSKSRYTHSKRPVLQRPIESGQFTSWAFTSNVRNYGLKLSLGTVGDCYDNAMIESFWGRMQTELLNRKTWTTVVELSMEMADYIENFHNTRRRHSSLAMLTPTEYETTNQSQLQLS